MDLGMANWTEFGKPRPLSTSNIESWMNVYGVPLTMWEIDAILKMSRKFAESFHEFDEKDAASPYAVLDEQRRKDVSNKLMEVFARLSQNNKRGKNQPLRLRRFTNE